MSSPTESMRYEYLVFALRRRRKSEAEARRWAYLVDVLEAALPAEAVDGARREAA